MSVVKNFSIKLGSFQLQAPNIELLDNGVTALIGPSGSGKSSFAKALLGLIACESGHWNMKTGTGEIDLLNLPIERRRLGVVFQDFALFPHMTAKENILFAAQARKVNKDQAKESFDFFAETLQMKNFLNTKAGKLSGGEAQRTALARALIGQPRFLILDEAFVSLDKENKQRAYQLCQKVLNEMSVPTLLISHDASEVEALASKSLFIQDGEIKDSN